MTDDVLGMCIKHHDFHPMQGVCWESVLSWFLLHDTLYENRVDYEGRDTYQAAVERSMLEDLVLGSRL